ncbi:hypothetical protein DRN67_04020 [Candidatus Micrarchaeota archaeon]|nr:MAG: hypothetical protein DRN67_04020 [Candidatus Micrarchaeota archaeon]
MDLGKLQERMLIYSDVTGTEFGAIELHESGMRIKVDGKTLMVPDDYLERITPERELALGKALVKMVVYDVMGMKHELRFILSGVHLATLKKRCRK